MYRNPVALSLFWRTFSLLTLLLACGVGAWVQIARVVELEPRDQRDAHRIASVVGITKTALSSGGQTAGEQIATTLAKQSEGRLLSHASADQWEPLGNDRVGQLGERNAWALGGFFDRRQSILAGQRIRRQRVGIVA